MTKQIITIGWLYPDLMSIYGDRGNIIVLTKRLEWRGIEAVVKSIGLDASEKELASCDLLMMGGAQDRQQSIVAKDLAKKKKTLQEMIERGIPGVFVCGGYQFLGKYYKEADGTKIEQLDLLDFYTENPGEQVTRCIGNVSLSVSQTVFDEMHKLHIPMKQSDETGITLVGFENHGGRTYLGKALKPLGTIIKGFGNNAEDKGEGLVYKNTIGTYLHGPLLPKNPEIADWLLAKAILQKYKIAEPLASIDDTLSSSAKDTVLRKI